MQENPSYEGDKHAQHIGVWWYGPSGRPSTSTHLVQQQDVWGGQQQPRQCLQPGTHDMAPHSA
jgi:hypothetical protein